MRFFGEKLTVPVEWDSHCNEGWHWVQGFSLVLDQRFLPAGKPNPHHEAEKLIPALLLKQFLNQSANLQWFASPSDVSVWGKGLLTAFGLTVRFHNLPVDKDDSICFKDAVLFSGPTHVKYVPNEETNSLLRSQVNFHKYLNWLSDMPLQDLGVMSCVRLPVFYIASLLDVFNFIFPFI